MKTSLPIIVVMTLLAILDGGVVLSGQKQPPNLSEVRMKIKPADEIWSEYQKLKYEMTPAGRAERLRNIAAQAERDRKDREERERILAEQEKKQLQQDGQRVLAEKKAEYEQLKDKIPADEAKQLQELIRVKINEIREENNKIKEEKKPTVDEVKRARENIQGKFDEIQAEFDKIREKIAAVEEAKRKAEAERLVQEAEAKRKAKEAARPVDLRAELVKSGFKNYFFDELASFHAKLEEFVKYGNARLQTKLNDAQTTYNQAGVYEKEAALVKLNAVQEEIRVATEEIANKTYVVEYSFSVPERFVERGGDEDKIKMTIPTGFLDRMVNQVDVTFPFGLNVKVNSVKSQERIQSGGCIELSISGSTESCRELVRGSDKYRARVRFNNLRFDSRRIFSQVVADVLNLDIVKAGDSLPQSGTGTQPSAQNEHGFGSYSPGFPGGESSHRKIRPRL
ncbi:MAG: hypothetical protein FWC50_11300 [Planctomycetaceae bacterium]|nr:hypothetical protein [Planctomycetaceae bacterium]